jgi:ribosomal-protein-alanine N-acetyltransferase
MIYLETPRLVLRDWRETDLAPFARMNADEEVMRFFPKTLTYEETVKFYETIQQEFQECGYGLYAVETKEDGEFIGFIGFHSATLKRILPRVQRSGGGCGKKRGAKDTPRKARRLACGMGFDPWTSTRSTALRRK